MGHHARMLDLLHSPDAAIFCGAGAWDGGSGVLAGRLDGQAGMDKISEANAKKVKDNNSHK